MDTGSKKESELQTIVDAHFADFEHRLLVAYPALRRHATLDEFAAKHRDEYSEAVKAAIRTAMWRDS